MPLDFSKVPKSDSPLQTKDELLLDVTTGSMWRLKRGYNQRYKGALAEVKEARDFPGWFLCDVFEKDGGKLRLQLPLGWEWFRRTIRLLKEGHGDPQIPKPKVVSWRAMARMTVVQRKAWEEV